MSSFFIFADERSQITESCVRVHKTYKFRQVETKQKNNRKITLRSSSIRILVLIFSDEGRRYKITSKLKVAAFVSGVFTKAYCICVISKALNRVNKPCSYIITLLDGSVETFSFMTDQVLNGYLSPICSRH